MSLKVLVCGGRDYHNQAHVVNVLTDIHNGPQGPITTLIHGASNGADSLARNWARSMKIPVYAYPAKWNKPDGTIDYTAGPTRNKKMLDSEKPDLVVAFPGGRGTYDMIALAHNAGVPLIINRRV